MLTIKLHPEVVKFLRETGTVWIFNENEEAFVVNNTMYKQTDVEGIYTIEFIKVQEIDDNY